MRCCFIILAVCGLFCSVVAKFSTVSLDGHRFTVDVATTPPEQNRGLMYRSSLPADHGMLFVFQRAAPLSFWMKDTLIPLDMLFFDSNRRLVNVLRDVPPCKRDPCPQYFSSVPARYVLELNAGAAARVGAGKGDVFDFSK